MLNNIATVNSPLTISPETAKACSLPSDGEGIPPASSAGRRSRGIRLQEYREVSKPIAQARAQMMFTATSTLQIFSQPGRKLDRGPPSGKHAWLARPKLR